MKIRYIHILVGIFVFFALPNTLNAAEDDGIDTLKFRPWEFRVNVGYNIGGTIPVPFPVEIRSIEKFCPKPFSPHLAFEGIYWFNDKWGVSAQFTFDYKGFSTEDSVTNLPTRMQVEEDGEYFEGNFTGINSMEVSNSYFTVPVSAIFRPSHRWFIQAGIYVAYLYSPFFEAKALRGYIREEGPTGQKILIDETNPPKGQDFSKEQKLFDWGIQTSGEWFFTRRFSVRAQFSYGFSTLFKEDFTTVPFDLHNVFGTIGIGYTFRKL